MSEEQQTKLVFWEALEASTKTCLPRYSWIISSYWSERQTKTETAKLTTATTILCWQFQTGLKRTLASNRNKNRQKKREKDRQTEPITVLGAGDGVERETGMPHSLLHCHLLSFALSHSFLVLLLFVFYLILIHIQANDLRFVFVIILWLYL